MYQRRCIASCRRGAVLLSSGQVDGDHLAEGSLPFNSYAADPIMAAFALLLTLAVSSFLGGAAAGQSLLVRVLTVQYVHKGVMT